MHQCSKTTLGESGCGKTNIIEATATADDYILPFGKLTTPTPPAKSGQQVTLSIRPDAFEITERQTSGAIAAEILHTQFFGKCQELTCQAPNNPLSLIISAPAHTHFPDNKCYFVITTNGVSELEE